MRRAAIEVKLNNFIFLILPSARCGLLFLKRIQDTECILDGCLISDGYMADETARVNNKQGYTTGRCTTLVRTHTFLQSYLNSAYHTYLLGT